MFDFGLGSSELLLVAMIALIVIGPKDLPRLLRTLGQYMRKIQGMAREFQNHLNEAAKETGVDDVKKDIKGMTNFTVTADLDKQGAEIKKAIESSASKASPANGAKTDGAQTDGAKADGAKDGARADDARAAGQPPRTETAKPAKPQAAASSKPAPAGKAETARSSKPAPKAKAAAKPKPEAKPKPAARAKSKPAPKADRPRETAKS